MTKSMKNRRRHGFSLVEVIVATALLSLVGMIIAVSVHTFNRSYSKAQKVSQWLERNQALDRIAENTLRSAIPFTWPNTDTGEDEIVFEGEENELWLTAQNRSYGKQGAFRFVRIYQEDDQLLCDYSTTPLLPWLELEDQEYETELITDGVMQISFLYGDYEDNELKWYENWDEEEHDGFPLAIQLTVEWQDGTKERWLRRTAGTSTNTEYLTGTTPGGSTSSSGNSGGGSGGGRQ